VLYAGRWTAGKGIGELLEAMRTTPVHLILLGGAPPSGRTVDVGAIIAASGVADRVHVVGEVDDVWPYIYASDAVAVPSVAAESYPTIALEALAAGRPVLASDIGGLPEIVTPGRGWLLPPGDITAWSQCLAAVRPHRDLQQ
jgi:glycosyltransferase involved in cell wall biosynthesis